MTSYCKWPIVRSIASCYKLYCLLGVRSNSTNIKEKLIYFEGYTPRSIEMLKEFSI